MAYPLGIIVSGVRGQWDYRFGAVSLPVSNERYVGKAAHRLRPALGAGVTPAAGFHIGISFTHGPYLPDSLDPRVREVFLAAVERIRELGATVDFDLSLPSTGAALSVYYVLAPSEASANLARYDGTKYGYRHQVENGTMWDEMEQTRQNGFGEED